MRFTNATEFLNLLNIVLENFGLPSLMESIEFGNVVYLHIVVYTVDDSNSFSR